MARFKYVLVMNSDDEDSEVFIYDSVSQIQNPEVRAAADQLARSNVASTTPTYGLDGAEQCLYLCHETPYYQALFRSQMMIFEDLPIERVWEQADAWLRDLVRPENPPWELMLMRLCDYRRIDNDEYVHGGYITYTETRSFR